MSFFIANSEEILNRIGGQLRQARKQKFPHDTQIKFAKRLGIGRVTYQKMEAGDASVKFGSYLEAALLLDCEQDFYNLFNLPEDLFKEAGL